MREELLVKFEISRLEIIQAILEKIKCSDNQVICLKHKKHFRISDSEEEIITQIYKYIYISDKKLMINYDYGEGFEPVETENVSEELEFLSANEIYEIICCIPN